jgi:orotate phosphoribosyltransferase
MEVHHDLRKFITESIVAQRRHVLSSGREASPATDPAGLTVQQEAVPTARWASMGAGSVRKIINVGQLTLGAGIESSTAMGSDLWAAEALQEAETEVGAAVMIDQGADGAVRVAGQTYRSADPSTDLGLTA